MSLVKEELQKACKKGDYRKFLKYISTCKKLEFKDFEIGDTLLHHVVYLPEPESQTHENACIGSKLKIMEFLIKTGVDINCTNEDGRTPLHIASDKGFLSAVRLLLESGADINAKDLVEISPILLACSSMHHAVVKELLNSGANQEDINESVILEVVDNEDERTMKVLVENGYRVNFEAPWPSHGPCLSLVEEDDNILDDNDEAECKISPLHLASKNGYVDMVKILIGANADVTIRHKDGLYDIHHMAAKGDKEVIGLLVEKGACVDVLSTKLETPLCWACFNANLDTVQQLLECGANPFHRNIKGESLMPYAIKGGNVEIVRLLVKLGVKFEKIADEHYFFGKFSPLSIAAFFEHEEVFKYLLELGFQADEKEENGSSVIHFAARGGSYEITECILNLGIDVNIMNKDLETPLHIAIKYGNSNLCELLISYCSADINLGSGKEMTGLDKAIDTLLKLRCSADDYPLFFDMELLQRDYCNQIILLANRLKAAGLACIDRSVESIQLKNEDDKDYYRRCIEEIKLMKVVDINNDQTLYNLLSGSLKARIGLVNMPETEEALLKMEPFDKFPIYSSMLSVRLKRAIQMKRLLEIGTKFFMSLDIEPKLSYDCIDVLLSFINIPSLIALEKIISADA